MSRHDIAGNHLGCILLKTAAISLLTGERKAFETIRRSGVVVATCFPSGDHAAPQTPQTPSTAGGKQAKADEGGKEQKEDGKEEKQDGKEEKPELPPIVSRHDIAGIWVAFFSRWQRYRC